MAHIQWKDRYNIGYKDIDEQHKVLLDVLNELMDMAGTGGDPAQVTEIFHRLYDYVVTHFSTEERYMRSCHYPRIAEHEVLHGNFIQKLLELNNAYDPEDPKLLIETLEFLKDWYLDHIIKCDTDYIPSLKHYHAEAPIHAVLFDFGQVVCKSDQGGFLEGLSGLCGIPAKELEANLLKEPTLVRDYESGGITSTAFLKGMSALCGTDLPEADFIRVYTGIYTPNPGIVGLIQKIKAKHKVGLVAQTGPWRFEHAVATSECFSLFDSVTLSYEVGAVMPDPRLFEDALAKLELMAEECVYIDAKPSFAQAATEHLLHGIAYTTPVALMTELRRHKVVF